MTLSNRFRFVDRENLYGTIDGVDFGYNLSCIARSSTAALLWSGGTAYTSGRQTCYGPSKLYFKDRDSIRGHDYQCIGERGGRLTQRIATLPELLAPLFDADTIAAILEAVKQKKTLLIEGGGDRFAPDRRYGETAYQEWRREGFEK